METAVLVAGVGGILFILFALACLLALIVAKSFERAVNKVIIAAKNEERVRCAQHYATTSWWFAEFPDVQHALRLVTEEIITGRSDSSRLRDDWKKATGRK